MSTPTPSVSHEKPGGFITYHDCQQVLCPYCSRAYLWTDNIDMAREAEEKQAELRPEYRLGIIVAGREPVFLTRCKGETCGRPFVAKFESFAKQNAEREEAWWRNEGRYDPKNNMKGELVATPRKVFLKPKWIAITISRFVAEVREERNPFVRGAIIRRVEAAGWHIFPPNFLHEAAGTPPELGETQAEPRQDLPS